MDGATEHEYTGKQYLAHRQKRPGILWKIYAGKSDTTSLSGKAIVCLSHSVWNDNHWQHQVRDIYHDDSRNALQHFSERDDISHLILLPAASAASSDIDPIDDLRREYLHR